MTKDMRLTINLANDIIKMMEEDIIHKQWFSAEPLLQKFLKINSKEADNALMNRMQIDHTRLKELKKPGKMLGWIVADRYATRLGYHPCMIWNDWFDKEPEEGSKPKKSKKKVQQLSKESNHNACTGTQQP